jgi:hypothetical protein
VTVRPSHGSRPVVRAPDSAAGKAAFAAYKWAYGRRHVLTREGGAIPIAATLADRTGEVLFLGFGLHGQQEHAPDKWLSGRNFELADGSDCHVPDAGRRPPRAAGAGMTLRASGA